MKITRSLEQAGTLEQFYAELLKSDEDVSRSIGVAMLQLLRELGDCNDKRELLGLTSLHHLWLSTSQNRPSNQLVKVIGNGDWYEIQYRMPDAIAPWPNAYVRGEASSAAQAVSMILVAISRSEAGGVPANPTSVTS